MIRENKEKKIKVLLGERPDNESLLSGDWNNKSQFDILGIKIENIDSDGVKVVEIKAGSPASNNGIRSGDIIETIGRRIIKNESDYFDMMENYDTGDTIMLRIVRNNNASYIAFKIN